MGVMEPGSGSTIMSYADFALPTICLLRTLMPLGDAYFHIHSLFRIGFHKSLYSGCGQSSATGNSPPVITNPGAAATYLLSPLLLSQQQPVIQMEIR